MKSFYLDWCRVAGLLSRFHAIFYKMWHYGKPVITNTIPTAAAMFDRNGRAFRFLFNEEFWNKLTDYDKAFVVSHECLHVLFNHGKRGLFATMAGRQDQANIAMDLAINHILEYQFGFQRNLLGGELRGKTLFCEEFYPKGTKYNTEGSFEEHYAKISELIQQGKIKEIPVGVGFDDHSYLKPNEESGASSAIREIAKQLTNEQKEKLAKATNYRQAGTEKAADWLDISTTRPRKRRSWIKCFKKWTHRELFIDEYTDENFMNPHRRLMHLEQTMKGILLPGDNPAYIKKKDRRRIKICLFLDVSGSCIDLKDYFFEAARTMPPDKFDVQAFTFDTEVNQVNIWTDKIVGGGGTSFSCIENYIIQNLTKKEKYPKCVCLFTDGAGDNVVPMMPERWYWFLTEDHTTNLIPEKSNRFYLSDFLEHKK